MEKLDEEERQPLAKATKTQELIAALEGIKERTQKQQRLLDRVNGYPSKTITGAVTQLLKPGLPQFLYSSHYDRMVGQLRLDTYNARKQGQQQPPIEVGERVFLDFLEYAGTSLEEINRATTYEGLNARCEAASNRITQQLLEYWTQNPTLEIEVRVTKAELNDPPPFNQGVIARARVRNNLHKLTLPFSERSAGFIWFFSFLVKFAQVRKTGDNLGSGAFLGSGLISPRRMASCRPCINSASFSLAWLKANLTVTIGNSTWLVDLTASHFCLPPTR